MKFKLLSGNTLKMIAATAMLIDHIGLLLFPAECIFRIIGRLAFPIFAFMISESARYTKNKLRHFAVMFAVAAVCEVGYYLGSREEFYMGLCILSTFSISTLLIYAMQEFKSALFSKDSCVAKKLISGLILLAGISAAYFINKLITMDYGFIGCLTPVFASIFDFRGIDAPRCYERLDNIYCRILCMIPALMGLILNDPTSIQVFSVFSIPLLLLYSEKRGKLKLKYFFYVFYPLHLVLLYAIKIWIF